MKMLQIETLLNTLLIFIKLVNNNNNNNNNNNKQTKVHLIVILGNLFIVKIVFEKKYLTKFRKYL